MLRVVETFSGIGSQAKALEKMGLEYRILNTVEWDISAFYTYDIIHNGIQDLSCYQKYSKAELLELLSGFSLSTDGKNPVNMNFLKTWSEDSLRRVLCAYKRTHNLGSITNVTPDMLPKRIDLLTYSFPCQDLSICGSWHGNMSGIDRDAHNRSGLLWEIDRLLKEMKDQGHSLPRFLLMENVNNILSRKHAGNFQEWKDILEKLGYYNQVYTLNASNFGIPQKRVRTYMLSVLCNSKGRNRLTREYFSEHNLEVKEPVDLPSVKQFLRTDYNNPVYREEADHSNPNNTESRRRILNDNEIIFDGADHFIKTVNTLTTKQDRNPNSGVILYPEHGDGKSEFRYLTPRECFLLMGFDEEDYSRVINNNFEIHKGKTLYTREGLEKLAGNSIVVDVLMAIFTQVNDLKKLLWGNSYIPVNEEKRKYHKRNIL